MSISTKAGSGQVSLWHLALLEDLLNFSLEFFHSPSGSLNIETGKSGEQQNKWDLDLIQMLLESVFQHKNQFMMHDVTLLSCAHNHEESKLSAHALTLWLSSSSASS